MNLPDLKNKPKAITIAEWLISQIDSGQIEPGSLLPPKNELAYLLGVSPSTIRNALRLVQDRGFIESKQCVGAVVRPPGPKNETLAKQVEANLRAYAAAFGPGTRIPASGELAKKFNVSIKTVYDAMKVLIAEGVLLARRGRYGTIVAGTHEPYSYEKTYDQIKNMLAHTKLPSIKALAQQLKVSQNTIRKALAILVDEGYITFSRGRYGGTFVVNRTSS
jgi:DNA-binding GntR family transcriptional regulator